jgi:peptidoglycan/xylan/chitin deacetylase (PgdA/CDA1 family)
MSTRRRRWPIVMLCAVAALAVLALAAAAGGGPSRRPATAATGSHTTPPAAVPVRPRVPAPAAAHHRPAGVQAVLRYTPFVTAGSSRRREVALTFDDGPGPLTAELVHELRRLRVPGTFFVVGEQLNRYASVVRQEVRAGDVIGDHTENHAWLVRLPRAKQLQQIRDCALRLRFNGAGLPVLMRPPYGAVNRTTLAVARSLGMLVVLWSVDTDDWRRPGTAVIVQRALEGARPGAIILMHDGGGPRAQTLAAVPAIVRGLRRRGLVPVTVPRLLADDPPPRHQRLPAFTGA